MKASFFSWKAAFFPRYPFSAFSEETKFCLIMLRKITQLCFFWPIQKVYYVPQCAVLSLVFKLLSKCSANIGNDASGCDYLGGSTVPSFKRLINSARGDCPARRQVCPWRAMVRRRTTVDETRATPSVLPSPSRPTAASSGADNYRHVGSLLSGLRHQTAWL